MIVREQSEALFSRNTIRALRSPRRASERAGRIRICIALLAGGERKISQAQSKPERSHPGRGGETLWEADAIACRLSQLVNSDFWPMGDSLPDLVRWISWGYWNFVRACDRVHFERVTKQRYRLGPVRQDIVQLGLDEFASSAAILKSVLARGLVGRGFRHLRRFPCRLRAAVRRPCRPSGRGFSARRAWHERLMDPGLAGPFAGLDAPELPPIQRAQAEEDVPAFHTKSAASGGLRSP